MVIIVITIKPSARAYGVNSVRQITSINKNKIKKQRGK